MVVCRKLKQWNLHLMCQQVLAEIVIALCDLGPPLVMVEEGNCCGIGLGKEVGIAKF